MFLIVVHKMLTNLLLCFHSCAVQLFFPTIVVFVISLNLCKAIDYYNFTFEMWDLEHRAFAMRRLYANAESVPQVQRDFRQHLNVLPLGVISDRNTILRWMHSGNT